MTDEEANRLSSCGFGCYIIGGPWIRTNPACPSCNRNVAKYDEGYQAGHAAARAEAEALLRECRRTLTDVYPFHATPAILDRIDAYLAGGGKT